MGLLLIVLLVILLCGGLGGGMAGVHPYVGGPYNIVYVVLVVLLILVVLGEAVMEALIAIWAFCYIFGLLPVEPGVKLIVNVLGLVLIILVMFAPIAMPMYRVR